MGTYLCKLDGMYFEWSTIVDAPTTYGMTLKELRSYVHEEYGRDRMGPVFKERLRRVESKGTSSHLHGSVEHLVLPNRAGPKESSLSLDALKIYLRTKRYPKPLPLRQRAVLQCADVLRADESLLVCGHDRIAARRLVAKGLGTIKEHPDADPRIRWTFRLNDAGRAAIQTLQDEP